MRTIITCMGECLIDFLPTRQEETTIDFRLFPAGSLLNVAVGIARLGQPAAWAGRLADDYLGRYLYSYMRTEGLDTRFLVTGPGRTALAFVAMEAGQPAYTFSAALLTQLMRHGLVTRVALQQIPPDELRAMIVFAHAAEALNCLQAGAQPPHESAVRQFIADHS